MKMNENKTLLNSIYLITGNLFSIVLGFIVTFFLGNYLQPRELGYLTTGITFATFGGTLLSLGLYRTIVRYSSILISQNRLGELRYLIDFILQFILYLIIETKYISKYSYRWGGGCHGTGWCLGRCNWKYGFSPLDFIFDCIFLDTATFLGASSIL